MDIKSMLLEMAEHQAKKIEEEAIKSLGSDQMAERIATAINKKIDIADSKKIITNPKVKQEHLYTIH